MKKLLVLVMALALFALPAMAQWVETDDAGNLPAIAQIPMGAGPLATIAGNLSVGDVDMYCIMVTDPATFGASTVGGATWDTQLFVFTEAGVGVTMNDDATGLQSTIGAFNTCMYSVGAGTYYIAISRFNSDPRDAAGGTILGLSGCNSTNANPIASWTASTGTAGDYVITLTNVNYCETVATEGATWGAVKSLYR
jgi:hypothetical protein